jgi:hypothetical protein
MPDEAARAAKRSRPAMRLQARPYNPSNFKEQA